MKAEDILGLVIILLVAAVMLVLGIVQFTSKRPVTFYTGEKPLDRSRYSNVKKWNRLHGIMWIIYGFIIICGGCIMFMIGSDTPFCVIPFFAAILCPLPLLILCHKKLSKKYIIEEREEK